MSFVKLVTSPSIEEQTKSQSPLTSRSPQAINIEIVSVYVTLLSYLEKDSTVINLQKPQGPVLVGMNKTTCRVRKSAT
jgi:hypothetical protein